MAKSFAKVFEKLERHDKAFELIFKEMQNYGKEAREHRMMMSGLNHFVIIPKDFPAVLPQEHCRKV